MSISDYAVVECQGWGDGGGGGGELCQSGKVVSMVIMSVSDLAVGEWGGGGGEWFVLDR